MGASCGSSWPHHLAFTRLVLTWHESWDRDPAPWVRDPAREVRRIHLALFRRMAREAAEAGVGFPLLVLPSQPDLAARARGGAYWAGLIAALADEGARWCWTRAMRCSPPGPCGTVRAG